MMADNMVKPMMYPCASRVKMPQVGADETNFKPTSVPDSVKLQRFPSKSMSHGVSKFYLKKVSTGLSFSEDVVKERCFHTLPYSDKYFYDALDVSGLIDTVSPRRGTVGRHDTRGSDRRHLPCHINKRSLHKLKPIKPKTPNLPKLENRQAKTQRSLDGDDVRASVDSGKAFFLTESSAERPETAVSEVKAAGKWDQYLLSIMSQTTSEWIVKQRVAPGGYKEQLESFITDRYGPIKNEEPELVTDTISEIDFDTREYTSNGRWKKADANMLEKVREMTEARGLPTDPYADNNTAAFYRLPAGFRRAKKHQDKEEAGAINSTAYKIELQPYKPPPPPTLKDYMNPAVGNTMHDTDNKFEQEWLTGAKPVHQSQNQSEIILDSDNRYRKQLVKECPRPPALWCSPDDAPSLQDTQHLAKFERGLHRWKALPQPIDDMTDQLTTDAGTETIAREKEKDRRNTRGLTLLQRILEDWRGKWHLDMRYADATPEDLIADMADIHPHIRLKAITTCARAADYTPPRDTDGIQLDHTAAHMEHVKLLPDNLFVALEICLEDDNLQVQRAAAITLYTLEKPTDRAEELLREALTDETAIDRWTAAQCLAYFGECDSEVVSELISQLLTTEDQVKHDQARALLSRLSEHSTLVHSMIGEQLNSSSWRHRVMACRILPKLNGNINKDLVNKLTHLMWSDWHHEVRKMAAQTLGRTGHGKHVHDELREKILTGNEKMRVEAVSKVGHLGIMTAKLLPAFLQCFEDSYVSVRMEVCIATSNLRIQDERILDKLVSMATYDPIWKVKALAIQAMGTLGIVTAGITDCVLWAFRYEDQPGVRVEACHTIIRLQLNDPKVAQMLQDRYLVETSDIVKSEIEVALEMFGISPSQDMDMVTQIKASVRKLCARDNIAAQITQDENIAKHQENLERLVVLAPNSPKREKTPRYRQLNREMTRVTSAGSIQRSEISSRPFSQDAAADREICAIFDRYDDDGSSHVTVLDNADSQLGMAKSDLGGSRMSRSKSFVTFASPAAEDGDDSDEFEAANQERSGDGSSTNQERSGDGSSTNQEISGDGSSTNQSEKNLGEAQTYVEISGDPAVLGDISDHVVAMEHRSADGSPTGGSVVNVPVSHSPDGNTSDVEGTTEDSQQTETENSNVNGSETGEVLDNPQNNPVDGETEVGNVNGVNSENDIVKDTEKATQNTTSETISQSENEVEIAIEEKEEIVDDKTAAKESETVKTLPDEISNDNNNE